MKKLNTKTFIERSIEKHGTYYDYSNSEYISYRKPLTIICPHHGEFNQLASNHMKGSGCRQCGQDRLKNTTESFITESISILSLV